MLRPGGVNKLAALSLQRPQFRSPVAAAESLQKHVACAPDQRTWRYRGRVSPTGARSPLTRQSGDATHAGRAGRAPRRPQASRSDGTSPGWRSRSNSAHCTSLTKLRSTRIRGDAAGPPWESSAGRGHAQRATRGGAKLALSAAQLPDADDRNLLAAAIRCRSRASVIVQRRGLADLRSGLVRA
jgi:hypothetical protein